MKQKSLTGFMNEVIEELCQQERLPRPTFTRIALRAFTEFVGGGEIFFGGLNKSSLAFPAPSGRLRSYNTISTYIRALRAVYNRAVDRELII